MHLTGTRGQPSPIRARIWQETGGSKGPYHPSSVTKCSFAKQACLYPPRRLIETWHPKSWDPDLQLSGFLR